MPIQGLGKKGHPQLAGESVHVPKKVGAPHAPAIDAVEKGAPKAISKHDAKLLKALGPAPLLKKLRGLSDAAVRGSIASTENLQPMPSGEAIAAVLKPLQIGQVAEIPLNMIHPGQVQISFTNVRQKMEDFVERLDERREAYEAHPKSSKAVLLDSAEALTAVIGPDGHSLILTDGHHHVAALKAVQAMVHKILGPASLHPQKPGKNASELEFISQLFGGAQGSPSIPIRIVGDLRDLPEKELWKTLASGVDGHKMAYLIDADGKTHASAGAKFSKLQNNPYRYLASVITGKIELTKEQGKLGFTLRGGDPPVWLKVLGHTADFIEFSIARALVSAYKKVGKTYDPKKPLTDTDRLICRWALMHAKLDPDNPEHEMLKDLIVTTKDRSQKKLEKRLEIEDGQLHIPRKIYQPSKRRLKRLDEAFQKLVH
ncbi:MAG: ParB/Srx family N-terminal domain-containing protein [Myxococcota bacterium]